MAEGSNEQAPTANFGPRSGDPMIDQYLPIPGSFEDRLYAVAAGPSSNEFDWAIAAGAAHDILAMPEMKAIRQWIAERAREVADEGWSTRQALGALPPVVIDWVLHVGAAPMSDQSCSSVSSESEQKGNPDLAARLRAAATDFATLSSDKKLIAEAADELERLSKALEAVRGLLADANAQTVHSSIWLAARDAALGTAEP